MDSSLTETKKPKEVSITTVVDIHKRKKQSAIGGRGGGVKLNKSVFKQRAGMLNRTTPV